MSKVQAFIRIQLEPHEAAYEFTWEKAEELYNLLHAALRKDLDKKPAPLPTAPWPVIYRDGAAYTMKETEDWQPKITC